MNIRAIFRFQTKPITLSPSAKKTFISSRHKLKMKQTSRGAVYVGSLNNENGSLSRIDRRHYMITVRKGSLVLSPQGDVLDTVIPLFRTKRGCIKQVEAFLRGEMYPYKSIIRTNV